MTRIDPHSTPLIRARNLSRHYGAGAGEVPALDGIDLDLAGGEFLAVTGPSGCGKSTLLHLLAGLDRPDAGELVVGGLALHEADEGALTRYRRTTIGVVFQFFHLLPTMTVLENAGLPLLLQGRPGAETRARAQTLLEQVGLSGRAGHLPHQLSGGEMQRCAIARALAHRPTLLLADEPTGNLDTANAGVVMDLLADLHGAGGLTLVVVTHDALVARRATRHLPMRDGRVEGGD